MAVVRWTNVICGGLLVIAALAFVVFVPGNISNFAGEPEDVWLGGFWIGSLGLLAALCFANAWRANGTPRFGWRISANVVAIAVLAVLLVFGRNDPAVPPLLALCALGPIVALVGAWRGSRVQR
jgi:hypothetical protein